MLTSTYTAYGKNGVTIKAGTVMYEADDNQNQEAMNFGEAVVAEVGEEVFDTEVYGIRD